MSYSPPLYAQKSYTVTNVDLLNAIVIPPTSCKIFQWYGISDAAYDGNVWLGYMAPNGVWVEENNQHFGAVVNTPPIVFEGDPGSLMTGEWDDYPIANIAPAFPYVVRARVSLKATVGQIELVLTYAP